MLWESHRHREVASTEGSDSRRKQKRKRARLFLGMQLHRAAARELADRGVSSVQRKTSKLVLAVVLALERTCTQMWPFGTVTHRASACFLSGYSSSSAPSRATMRFMIDSRGSTGRTQMTTSPGGWWSDAAERRRR